MLAIAFLFVRVLRDCFKSRRRLEAEILVLRHQLNILRLRTPRRPYLTWADRAAKAAMSASIEASRSLAARNRVVKRPVVTGRDRLPLAFGE